MATRNAIAELRSRLDDVEDTHQLIQDDIYLALWLNLKNSDLRKAEAATREALKWWEANASALVQETVPPGLSSKLPIFFDEIGKDGLPLAYIRMTALDLHGLFSQFTTADALRYTLQIKVNAQRIVLETNRLQYEKLGDEALKSARGHVAVLDAYDISRRHLPPLKAINLIIQTFREAVKVPSCAKVVYVIGVGTILRAIIKPLTPILQGFGVTIKVYGTDEKMWETDLGQIIDKKMLEELRDRASKAGNENVTCDQPRLSRWFSSDWITG